FVEAAKAGQIGRFWYERSMHAFQSMRELAPDYFEANDADKWAGVVAATSPQQGVPLNLREALDFWKGWVDSGRPMDEAGILAKQKTGEIPHLTNQGSKLPNVLKAINGEEMLPPEKKDYYKVGSFAGNLRGIKEYPHPTLLPCDGPTYPVGRAGTGLGAGASAGRNLELCKVLGRTEW